MEDLTLLLRLARALGDSGPAAPAHTAPAPTPNPYQVGEAVFIRTVTYHYTGRIVAVYPNEIVLMDAAWIADSGRWSEALRTGNLAEVEPYPDGAPVVISRASITDATTWAHPLPRIAK